MAEIRVFPVARRRGLIVKNARLAATYSDAGARNHLASVVAQHLKRLHRLGVDPEEAGADAEALRTALGSHYARFRAMGGVA